MKILIIPVQESIAKDLNTIYNALEKSGEQEYANKMRNSVQWGEVTPADPYIEMRVDE